MKRLISGTIFRDGMPIDVSLEACSAVMLMSLVLWEHVFCSTSQHSVQEELMLSPWVPNTIYFIDSYDRPPDALLMSMSLEAIAKFGGNDPALSRMLDMTQRDGWRVVNHFQCDNFFI